VIRAQPGDQPSLPLRVGNYRIDARIGAGGMGVVYRAFDEALKRPLAVKHFLADSTHPTANLRFRREAQAAARLNHPAIVHIYDIVETSEGAWIVMELVEGQTLERRIGESGLDLPEAIRLGREVAEGLAEAHAQGVIHRDLKAANVMVTTAGRAKILDFGIAKLVEPGEPELTREGVVVGTYHAMSPEQAQGLPLDLRSDLFSFGSLLYEMLTGRRPFRAEVPHETLRRICTVEPEAVCNLRPDVPRELSDLVRRLLRKSPGERPQSAGEVARGLDDRLLERASRTVARTRPRESSEEITLLEGALPGARIAGSPEASSAPSRPTRERRQMTVVCCELVEIGEGDRSVSATFDPELLYELMHEARGLATAVAGRYGGHLENAFGHRLLIYFGYPQPHEDNARRAVQTALELVDEVPRRIAATRAAHLPRLELRAGIHTGVAVVSTDPHPAPVTLGATLDLAIQLLALAEPGSVVVSPAASALLGKGFTTEELPPIRLPGLANPVSPHRVLQVVEAAEESSAPLVGRELEMETLLRLWRQSREGSGQVVLLSGEPGIGKSRLVHALRERLEESATWLSCHGSPFGQNSPLQPVVGLLRKAIALYEGSSRAARLRALLGDLGQDDAFPFLAALLDLPAEERPAAPELPPDRLREKTLDALVALFLGLAEHRPLVLLVEDLHWLDPTSLNWLDRLLDQAMTTPLLLVLTLRLHTMEALWGPRAHLTSITLQPLSEAEAERLIERVAGENPLSAAVQRRIVARTDGIPLFLEELTKAVIESERSGEHSDLPATLRDSLTERLDRLGTAKEVAQLAAVLGRAFSLELLAAVSGRDEVALQPELRRLVQSELVQRRGSGKQTRYLFKHALIQDAAYDSLLKRERQALHQRIAETLRDRFPDVAEAQPELLAHHYTEASLTELAVDSWHRAGELASSRSAIQEAMKHLNRALELLAGLPEGPGRDRQELRIQNALAVAITAGLGHIDPAVEQAYLRADLLAERLAATEDRFWAVQGLYTYHLSCGNLDRAVDLSGRLVQIAEESGTPTLLSIGRFCVGALGYYQADFAAALPDLERALELAPPDDSTFRTRTGLDLCVLALVYGALSLWHLGRPDRARSWGERAIHLARDLGHPFTLAFAFGAGAELGLYLQDAEFVRREALALHGLAAEFGFPLWTWQGERLLAWVQARSPHPTTTAFELRDPHTVLQQIEQGNGGGAADYYVCVLIETLLHQGRTQEALAAVEQILPHVEAQGGPAWTLELHRLWGEMLLDTGLPAAESHFARSWPADRRNPSRSLELRAALSLGRLRRSQGREAEAHELVASAYRGFGEGFSTHDLQAAKAFLDSFGDTEGQGGA
jgi:TOMM system kinase/cyclase fusion protein